MRVLVGCEESQVVAKAFRDSGHEAYSCDLIETRGNPDWHYQMDVKECIKSKGDWDLIILHPDCTAMALSGNRWYGRGMPHYNKRIYSVGWTLDLWNIAIKNCSRVVLENPASVIFPVLRKNGAAVQFVQPYEFGHGEKKKTGFALYNVNELKPTNVVNGREQRVWKMPPSPNRKRDRSKTYSGIAKAMAEQWILTPPNSEEKEE